MYVYSHQNMLHAHLASVVTFSNVKINTKILQKEKLTSRKRIYSDPASIVPSFIQSVKQSLELQNQSYRISQSVSSSLVR